MRSGDHPVMRINRSAVAPDPASMRPSRAMFVFTKVGHTAVATMSVPVSSAATVSVNDRTAAFDTL